MQLIYRLSRRSLARLLRTTPIGHLVLLILFTGISATGNGQTVTMSVQKAPLQKVFAEIEKQTGFRFVYRWELIKDLSPVDLDLKNVALKTALDSCLRGQPLRYSIVENTIVINEQPEKQKSNVGMMRVRGVIKDKNGEPLEGATLKDRFRGIVGISNAAGEFVIESIEGNAVLEVSYIGYVARLVNVSNRAIMEVILDLDINSLEETVVKGYYSTSRRLSTGTVGKVTSEQISRQPVSSPLAALQGRVPGLLVSQSNGWPGSNFNVVIRGRNSIQSGNAPLYVVDGVPFASQRIGQLGEPNTFNPFNSINPLDIESIEVLKDADATAIYGSRGANGVILITTKKAKAGESSIEITARQGWGKITRFPDMLNTPQYLQMRREAFANDGITPNVSNAYDLLVYDSTMDTDWKDVLIGGTAKQTTINTKISGGTESLRYTIGGAYYKETSVFPEKFGNERKTVSVSLQQKGFNNRLQVLLNLNYSADDYVLPNESPINGVFNMPNAPSVYDSTGKFRWSANGVPIINPIAPLHQKLHTSTERLTADVVLSYKILSNLLFKANLGYNTSRLNEWAAYSIAAQNPSIGNTGGANFGTGKIKTWIAEPQLEYRIVFNTRSKFDVLAGITLQENNSERSMIFASGYTNDNLLKSTAGASTTRATAASELYRYTAVYGRLNYQYDEKYIVNLTGRRDGSSRFGDNNRFANFGAAGIAWIFSKEKFFTDSKLLSFGKLRASYGITGNDQIGDYQYLDTWSAGTYPYQSISTLRPTRINNPDYVWESNRKLEFSLDLGFLKDRVLITASRFQTRTTDPIVSYNLPSQTGFNSVLRNFPGVVSNKGWELELSTRNIIKKNFEWSSSFNITFAKNKLESFPNLESSSYAQSYRVGKPLNAVIGFQYLGINPQKGVFEFADINKDNALNTLDYVYAGTTDPRFYGGFQNSLRFKSWSLDIFLQFVSGKGRDLAYSTGFPAGIISNLPGSVLNRWPINGASSTYQRYTTDWGDMPAYNLSMSDAVLTEASFVRLKNVSLSRNFQIKSAKRRNPVSINLFLQGQNLLTLTDYVGGDPESTGGFTLPPIAMMSAGIQLTL